MYSLHSSRSHMHTRLIMCEYVRSLHVHFLTWKGWLSACLCVSTCVCITVCRVFKCVCQRSHVACCGTWGLEVEWDHLAACVPEDLRHIITGVHPTPFGVDTAHLTLVVAVLALRNFFFFFLKEERETMCVTAHVCMNWNVCVFDRLQDYF